MIEDQIDAEIIMHRDVHFGGQFEAMIDYYSSEGKGVHPDFSLSRIEQLAALEEKRGENIAPDLLDVEEMERIAEAKRAYVQLRELYETEAGAHWIPRLIADLILSEEDPPLHAMEALIEERDATVPALIDLLRSEDFADPLFPGYGFAPAYAAECLGKIGDERSIHALFEALGQDDFFFEQDITTALHRIGEPAKIFLINILKGRPITADTERAAIALIPFKDDPAVREAAKELQGQLDYIDFIMEPS